MYNPRKVWLLYAKKLHELMARNASEIEALLKANLDRAAAEFGLDLDRDQKQRLHDIGMAFFQEEYLESYRLASRGEQPDTELSAIQSSAVVEQTTGYPVTELFRDMVQEIVDDRNRSEEEVVELLIEKHGAYPAQAVLAFDLRRAPIIENHLPDFCLAQAVQTIVERYLASRRPASPIDLSGIDGLR